MNSPETLSTRSSCVPISTTAGSFSPKTPRSWRGKKKKKTPTNAAPPAAMRAAACTAASARSGFPAPRFWPATAAAAPIRPTDVQVMSEKSWPYDTANAACAAALCASAPTNDSISTPPTFMAIPWIPVGRPKRKSERMMVQSGPNPWPRGKRTTQPPRHSFVTA